MKSILVLCVFLCISSLSNYGCRWYGYDDDRTMDPPPQDSVIEQLTSTCKKRSDLRRDPDQNSTYYNLYYMTFVYFKSKDTTRVIVMCKYGTPFVFHDRWGGEEYFSGYFKRNNTFCFFYNNLFHPTSEIQQIDALNSILKGWKLRSPSQNPEFFPQELGEQDPYIFEYVIDSMGNYSFVRAGYW